VTTGRAAAPRRSPAPGTGRDLYDRAGRNRALPPGALPRGLVLVVYDDEMVLALVEGGVDGAGYRVTTATSGAEAPRRLCEPTAAMVVFEVVGLREFCRVYYRWPLLWDYLRLS